MEKKTLGVLALVLVAALSGTCFAMGTPPPTPTPVYTHQLLAKADIDECYNGIGQPYVPGPTCGADQKPKANQAYLWSLAKFGDTLWFGTAANILCLMNAGTAYMGNLDLKPFESNLWVCEYSQGQYLTQAGIEAPSNIFSDYRPPKIYTYNLNTKTLTDKSAAISDPQALSLLNSTYGFRSGIAYNNLIFLAGPMGDYAAVNMFVFDALSGQLLGAQTLSQYNSIRRWTIMNNLLYTTVSTLNGGGRVLRWTGGAGNLFSFEEVGVLDAKGAEITPHNGRLYAGTWPSAQGVMPGLWMSPAVPSGGLTAADANRWTKVWQTDQFEPDPIIANLYGMGAMISYGGQLYWGTMHDHANVVMLAVQAYGIGIADIPSAFFNVWRATSIFRGSNFENGGKVELLYGDARLPVYVPTAAGGAWVNRANKMSGLRGKYGKSGFGNQFNNYTWSMAIYKNQLFVGTMDNSYLWLDWTHLVTDWFNGQNINIPALLTPDQGEFGGDLWRFPSTSAAAVNMTRDGYGNFANYGFRTAIADGTGLYLGTANPANVAQDSNGNPIGGWELIQVKQE
ncbi:MAG: hypothetical protein M0036_13030 [Desulfobacteraceae bacterium]|nr:hypothetical protein [Desulfobacteraceae bacterium]